MIEVCPFCQQAHDLEVVNRQETEQGYYNDLFCETAQRTFTNVTLKHPDYTERVELEELSEAHHEA